MGDVCSFKARRMWDTKTAVEKSDAQLQEVWTALKCCVLVFFHGFWHGRGRGERRDHANLVSCSEVLPAGLCHMSHRVTVQKKTKLVSSA